jgi:ribonuclease P protein component
MTAAWSQADQPAVRFGITVGKRNARRAVDRALVKRIVREASRHAAAALEEQCRERGLRLDVAFRLKARRDAGLPSLNDWRRALRLEADGLIERLQRQLAQPKAAEQGAPSVR